MVIKGIGASDGYAMTKVYKYQQVDIKVSKRTVNDIQAELDCFSRAIADSQAELEQIRDKTVVEMDEEHAAIFDAHISIITDPELTQSVEDKIKDEKVNADYAFKQVADTFVVMFETMDDSYLKERAADIKDVSKRVLKNIQGIETEGLAAIKEEVIIVADDLTPSDTAQLDKRYVKGFVTNVGGRTSHSAIMARSLEIPAVVGTKTAYQTIKDDSWVILDGFKGEIILEPTSALLEDYRQKEEKYRQQKTVWATFKDKQTVTADGLVIDLAANIGSPDDLETVLANGAEGIGLYRTEFLYMGNSDFPTEEQQFTAYRQVLQGMGDKPVVVRTLDIGGDKELPYFDMPDEMNPFLGNRAIRLCMTHPSVFRTQLRALLRASSYGNLKIMFPMIATVDEFLEAKALLKEVEAELIDEGQAVSDNYELGIMIEIPAAAILAHVLAKEVDFFSIGTNDLIQYTFAADRMNEKVSYLYQPYNPSLLNLIDHVIKSAHKEGKWVGMCGEMAGEVEAMPILLGLGLDEFSMSASSILRGRHLVANLKAVEAEALAQQALQAKNQQEVKRLVERFMTNLR